MRVTKGKYKLLPDFIVPCAIVTQPPNMRSMTTVKDRLERLFGDVMTTHNRMTNELHAAVWSEQDGSQSEQCSLRPTSVSASQLDSLLCYEDRSRMIEYHISSNLIHLKRALNSY